MNLAELKLRAARRRDDMTTGMTWMRVGVRGDYESFDSVEDASEELHSYLDFGAKCLGHTVSRHSSGMFSGIDVDGFCSTGALGGISLYYGDAEANLASELDDSDIAAVGQVLNAAVGQVLNFDSYDCICHR